MRESFWEYSVRVYGENGVADALLALQNDYGADVNMLLFCYWTGGVRGRFSDELFDAAYKFSQLWYENVVGPLRNTRVWMKKTGCQFPKIDSDSCMSLRDRIKSVELQAEKLQQATLESLCTVEVYAEQSNAEIQGAMAANLKRYLDAAAISLDERAGRLLDTVVRANFPDQNISVQFSKHLLE